MVKFISVVEFFGAIDTKTYENVTMEQLAPAIIEERSVGLKGIGDGSGAGAMGLAMTWNECFMMNHLTIRGFKSQGIARELRQREFGIYQCKRGGYYSGAVFSFLDLWKYDC